MLNVKSKGSTKKVLTSEDNAYQEYDCQTGAYGLKLCLSGPMGYLYGWFLKSSMQKDEVVELGTIPERFLPMKAEIFGYIPVVTNPDEDPTNKMVSISAAKNGKITMKASDAFSNGLVKFRIPFFSVLLGGGGLSLLRNLGLWLKNLKMA